MSNLLSLPARDGEAYHVVVESPRGSGVKLKYDPALQAMSVSRPLVLGLTYPFDWGFVPGTRAPDGDPVDAAVVWDVASFPGVVLKCRPLGILAVEQKGPPGTARVRNDRVVMLPLLDRRAQALRDVFALTERMRSEFEAFFLAATTLTDKDVRLGPWSGPAEAERWIQRSLR